jgi:hypothetical protein
MSPANDRSASILTPTAPDRRDERMARSRRNLTK